MASMRAQLVRIGNSRGVRIPKPLIDLAGLEDDVRLEVRGRAIVISAPRRVREGWAEAARRLRAERGDALLDEPTPTRFDEEEWRW